MASDQTQSESAQQLYDAAMALPFYGPGSERRHALLMEWGQMQERERVEAQRTEQRRLLAGCGLVRGDRVQRRSARGLVTARNPVGVVEGLVVVDGKVKAQVHWLSGQRRIGGGSDYRTTVLAGSLVKVTQGEVRG